MDYARPLPTKIFSGIEIKDLVKAWFAIALAFTILFGRTAGIPIWYTFGISLLTAGLGFLLHELGHKFVAQHYGYWAEFRADNKMLIVMLATSLLGFLFAAPGAVYIHGHVNKKYNGHISLAGPLVNLVLALVFAAMFFSGSGWLTVIGLFGWRINAFLGIFNMLPFWQFDGKKIKKWNAPVFWGMIVSLGILVVGGYLV